MLKVYWELTKSFDFFSEIVPANYKGGLEAERCTQRIFFSSLSFLKSQIQILMKP